MLYKNVKGYFHLVGCEHIFSYTLHKFVKGYYYLGGGVCLFGTSEYRCFDILEFFKLKKDIFLPISHSPRCNYNVNGHHIFTFCPVWEITLLMNTKFET